MADETDRSDFIWNVHSYVNEYIRFADTKAELVIGWTSALIGLLIAGDFDKHFGMSVQGVLCLSGFALLVAAFGCGFWTVLPRLWTTQKPGLIFWGSILAHANREDFIRALAGASAEDLNRNAAHHLADLSRVCDSKFWWVGRSIWLAFAGSMLSGGMYLWMR